MLAACLDLAASTIFRQFVTRLFTFLYDVIDEIQSNGVSMNREWTNLPKIAYVKQITGRILFFWFSAAIFMQSVHLLGLW